MTTPYYQDESVTLYHGDCREITEWRTACVTVTDPPYNVGLDYSGGDDRHDYAKWTQEWVALCPRPLVVTPGVVNLGMWLAMEPPRWTCAWVKPNQCSASALNGFNIWEPVLVYGRHLKPVGQDAWVRPITTMQTDAVGHPCPKDLRFWRALVERFTVADSVVADPFAGSGTTLVAAKYHGLHAVGVEIDEGYCEIAAKRLAQGVLDFGATAPTEWQTA